MQVVHPFQQVHPIRLLQLQIRQHNVYGRVFQDFQRLVGSGHADGLHPALLGDGGAGLADGLLVIHDENAHRDNFAADSGFLAHNGHPETPTVRIRMHLKFHFRKLTRIYL